MAVQPAFTWTATAGTIGSGGLLTAPATAGSATIRAASRTVQGSAAVTYTTSDFLGLNNLCVGLAGPRAWTPAARSPGWT